jgi:hypothetical protein
MTSQFIESLWHIHQLNTLSSVEPTPLIRSLAYIGNSHHVGISEALKYNPYFIKHRNADLAKEWLPQIVHLNLGGGLAKLVYESVCMGEYAPKFRICTWYYTETVWATRHLLEVWEGRPGEVLSEDVLTEQLSNFRWRRPLLDQPIAAQEVRFIGWPRALPPRFKFFNPRRSPDPARNLVRGRWTAQPDPKIDVPYTGLDGINWFSAQTYESFL